MKENPKASRVGAAAAFAIALALGCGSPAQNDSTAAPEKASTKRPAMPEWRVPIALPGSTAFPSGLRRRLSEALSQRAPEYVPRTHHLRNDGSPRYTNRLVLESSPYLAQHAHNPVDWRPWGDEAFAEARRRGLPVFLSIGYSTCHWCHVMERESFEDEEVAALLNTRFIPIKVDREERPDVDAVYMAVVQMLTGSGGWPMTVVLTPDREPFFGGTYFPKRQGDRGSRTGLMEILESLSEQYRKNPQEVVEQAKSITQRLRAQSRNRAPGTVPDEAPIARAAEILARTHDTRWGGFGRAPKFPRPVTLDLLLRHARLHADSASQEIALRTLDQMANGGLRDHIGGGFHRYATDQRWRIPHFEKMLYDNALLVIAYLDAYQVTGEPRFAEIARETLAYLEREMLSPEGGFYAATDADSPTPAGHEEEGWFFTWTPEEIREVLDPSRAELIIDRYGITESGNFERRNIPYAARTIAEVARRAGLPTAEAADEISGARKLLYRARANRPPPLRDDKVLAAWNGLAISAFSRAGRVLRDPAFTDTARATADFLKTHLLRDGRLARYSIHGVAHHQAVLADYAFLIAGLIDLYESSFDPQWLALAIELQGTLDENFWDTEKGGYFMTSDDAEELLVRRKQIYDGAQPAGNSVANANLLRLYEFTGDPAYEKRAEELLTSFAATLRSRPTSSPRLLSSLDFYLDTVKEIVLVRPNEKADMGPFLDALSRQYLPNAMIAATTQGAPATRLAKLIPLVKGKIARGGKVTAYVCENRVCALPTSDPEIFASQIATIRPRVESIEEAP